MIFTDDSRGSFLAARPDWTIDAACVTGRNGHRQVVTQGPFIWVDGAWQAQVSVRQENSLDSRGPVHLVLRISPDTLRRWKDVAIDPFIEACAQLQDHLRSAKPDMVGTLTLL